eukprot:TRINITY_DN3311_c0_g2_i1.p1 TRINITY_DN3311_c0_g2~~TRINITY_DN3311_c0_g2_i1.p1  ORF type:complete len:152 (-),score=34.80 TRINITY_DN3311_c0_g2_i1:136-591(-)
MSEEKNKTKKKKVDGDYQVPEQIAIIVGDPITHTDASGKYSYTDYKVTTNTNMPGYIASEFSVRRRYKQFVWLRAHIKQKLDEKGKRLTIPELPGNTLSSFFGSGRFEKEFVEERRKKLEEFLNSVVNHPWARFEEGLHKFLEEQDFPCQD